MRRIAGALLGLAALAAAWLLLAPSQLGGSTSYVVLYGASMEPDYRAGDLVLVRPGGSYDVGDVVAYEHPQLGRTVLHRVVAREGDRYQFKGDNNDFLDLPRPARVETRGAEWLHLPRVGTALEWIRQPVPAAVAALLCVLLAAGGGTTAARRRGGDRPAPAPPTAPGADDERALRAVQVALAVGGLVVAALAVGAIAWTAPLERTAAWPDRWRHEARLSYDAAVRPSAVYPSGRVATGDAVFARVAPRVHVRLDYAFRARPGDAVRLDGTAALEARVRGDNGWHRTIPLGETRTLRPSTALTGDLDLRGLIALVGRVEALTGTRTGAYDVTIAATVRASGSVGGDRVADVFEPSFAFRLVEGRLEAVPVEPDAASGAVPAAWERTQAGEGTRVVPASLALGPVSVRVDRLRLVALGLGALALLGLPLGLAYVLLAGRDGSAADPLEPWVVDVARVPTARETRDVDSPEALLRLVERFDGVVLRVVRPGGRLHAVELNGVLYRHVVGEVDDWPRPESRLPSGVARLPERAAR